MEAFNGDRLYNSPGGEASPHHLSPSHGGKSGNGKGKRGWQPMGIFSGAEEGRAEVGLMLYVECVGKSEGL